MPVLVLLLENIPSFFVQILRQPHCEFSAGNDGKSENQWLPASGYRFTSFYTALRYEVSCVLVTDSQVLFLSWSLTSPGPCDLGPC